MTEDERLGLLQRAAGVDWGHNQGSDPKRDYWAVSGAQRPEGRELWVKICPGGILHPHVDGDGMRKQHVLQSNDKALTYEDGVAYNLEEGGIYELDAALEHWSTNEGEEDRIHYVLLP